MEESRKTEKYSVERDITDNPHSRANTNHPLREVSSTSTSQPPATEVHNFLRRQQREAEEKGITIFGFTSGESDKKGLNSISENTTHLESIPTSKAKEISNKSPLTEEDIRYFESIPASFEQLSIIEADPSNGSKPTSSEIEHEISSHLQAMIHLQEAYDKKKISIEELRERSKFLKVDYHEGQGGSNTLANLSEHYEHSPHFERGERLAASTWFPARLGDAAKEFILAVKTYAEVGEKQLEGGENLDTHINDQRLYFRQLQEKVASALKFSGFSEAGLKLMTRETVKPLVGTTSVLFEEVKSRVPAIGDWVDKADWTSLDHSFGLRSNFLSSAARKLIEAASHSS